MKNYLAITVLLFCCLGLVRCTQTKPVEQASTETMAAPLDSIRDLPGLSSQRGLISNTDEATPGYILFHPTYSASTYLMNQGGQVVKEWKGEFSSMLTYLKDDGGIIRHERDDDFPTFAAGGQSGRIHEYNWDGEMTWNFEYISDKLLTHHDIAILPNGNILAIAWEVKTREESIELGVDPKNLPVAGLWFDKIIEIEPTRPTGGNIVWEWRMWDHLIQNYDESKANFGSIEENPRKVNLNPHLHPRPPLTQEQLQQQIAGGFTTSNATLANQGSDLTHLNAIEYNADLDQIAISSFHFGEIYIIDHSTTTEEASGSKGGKSGLGGDLLYRWGNPQNYGRGGAEDRKLYHQHDVRWIPEGFPGEGNLMVFDNDIKGKKGQFPEAFAALGQLQRPMISLNELDNYSAVLELVPPVDETGNYSLPLEAPFGPEKPIWSYMAPDTTSFYAPFVSNAHRLKNGNTFINSGPRGRFFEITTTGKIVWEYLNPFNDDYRLADGTFPQPAGPFFFAQYRVSHIPIDHPALVGKVLKPIDPQPEAFVIPPPPDKK
jgi:hypothetical protein